MKYHGEDYPEAQDGKRSDWHDCPNCGSGFLKPRRAPSKKCVVCGYTRTIRRS